ncbi:MAG: hypothetical protein QNJ31_03785 [Candidatus Caenarcaniphilales bacterium]|nr:hypothetical protein [Candidatus Caenarcaniphilales bacterium]
MNIRTKLESKEGKWVRVHFPDSSFLTGRLLAVGSDFVQLECFGKDDASNSESNSYTQHLIPLNLVKLITIEASSFLEAERRRLEYIARKSTSSHNETNSTNVHDLEK